MTLQWETLNPNMGFRAPAPLFGFIRVERYREEDGWEINWSAPGYTDTLLEGEWPDAESAKQHVETHVREVSRMFI